MRSKTAVTDGCLQDGVQVIIFFFSPSLKRGKDGVLIPLDPTDHTSTAKIGLSRTGQSGRQGSHLLQKVQCCDLLLAFH